MKVVILAGGLGTRISEESHLRPKPMIYIGEMPILIHIMKSYAAQGFKDFIICAGYKQEVIKEYFAHYFLYNNDVTYDFATNERIVHKRSCDDWKVTVVDTGLRTGTGGRIRRIRDFIGDEPFMLTYGDAVSDIDVKKLIAAHESSGKIGTISCYNLAKTKGVVDVDKDGTVSSFKEKFKADGDLINIGFAVFEPKIFDYIADDSTMLEDEPMRRLVAEEQLSAYVHTGFWQCMDTMREREILESYWNSGEAPWKNWEE